MRAFGVPVAIFVVGMLWAMSAHAEEWVEYKPEGGGFRVELPEAPQTVHKGYVVVVVKDAVCIVTHIEMGDPANLDPQAVLDSLVRAQVRLGTLRSEERLTIGSAPARRIVVEPRAGMLSTSLLVLSRTQLINVICTASGQPAPSPTVERVLRSFALIDQ